MKSIKIIREILFFTIPIFTYFIKSEKHREKRLLILRKDRLGDFILFLPTLKFYREYFKDWKITLVINSSISDLSPQFDFIDEIIFFDFEKVENNFIYRKNLAYNLKKKGFDLALNPVLRRNPSGEALIFSTHSKETIAFKRNWFFNILYTKIIESKKDLNELDRNIEFISKITNKNYSVGFPTIDINKLNNKKYLEIVEKYNLKNKKYCIFSPGAGAEYRMWNLDNFAKVSKYIFDKEIVVIIIGGQYERYLGNELVKLCKNDKSVINLVGETDLQTLSHLLNNSIFYFGNETGTMHLSAALSVPTIAVMGGGHFSRFFPYGDLKKNRIVYDMEMKCKNDDWKCAKNLKPGEKAPCIKNIKVEDAISEINILLKNN